jgi:DNA-binding transcriptional regulator YiaG
METRQTKKKGVNKLKKNVFISKMKLFNDTNESLAKYIGISRSRLNAKINGTGGAEFTQGEIQKIRDKYDLSNDEVNDIFF